jgi:two-component system sensor histidine kinase DegS
LNVLVQDDGIGFDATEPTDSLSGRYGVLGMQERAHLLGGELLIYSSPEDGTRLEVNVPVHPR